MVLEATPHAVFESKKGWLVERTNWTKVRAAIVWKGLPESK